MLQVGKGLAGHAGSGDHPLALIYYTSHERRSTGHALDQSADVSQVGADAEDVGGQYRAVGAERRRVDIGHPAGRRPGSAAMVTPASMAPREPRPPV